MSGDSHLEKFQKLLSQVEVPFKSLIIGFGGLAQNVEFSVLLKN